MGVTDRLSVLLDRARTAVERGDAVLAMLPPLIERGLALMDEGSALMERGATLMDRSERSLDRSDEALSLANRLLVVGTSYLERASENALLERRRLELEIARLERSGS